MSVREVLCEACNTLNRVPRYALRRIPHCGKCKAALPEPPLISAVRGIQRIPTGAWVGAVCFFGVAWFALSQDSSTGSAVSSPTTTIAAPAQCVAQEPATIRGFMRVYDPSERPSITQWTINAGAGANYFIKLVDAQTRQPKVAYFVYGGSSVTTDVPVGAFTIKHASGQSWCGEREFFGANTVFEEGRNIVVFDEDHTSTYYITPQRNGNFPTKLIQRDQF